MKIRLLDLNVKNKKIEKTENDSLRGALVHIKYKKEEKIMLKYDIDVISTCKPIINIKCIFQIEDDIELVKAKKAEWLDKFKDIYTK